MSNILKGLKKVDGKKTGIFAAGVLFGTAGIKVLSSKDAKDVYAEAQQINEDRAAKEEQEYAEAVAAEEAEEAEEAAEADETDFAEETAE